MANKISVLLIDHSPLIVEALRKMIERIPEIEIVGVELKVDDAIARDYDVHPQVIVYGMSVLVPVSLTSLPKLTQKLPDAFIVATGFDPNNEVRDAALGAGADAYVSGFKLDTELVPVILERIQTESLTQS